MKAGIELISEERSSQIKKGFTTAMDKVKYSDASLALVARCIVNESNAKWPMNWNPEWWHKFMSRDRIRQLSIAGALLWADGDRLGDQYTHQEEIESIASTIDSILNGKNLSTREVLADFEKTPLALFPSPVLERAWKAFTKDRQHKHILQAEDFL